MGEIKYFFSYARRDTEVVLRLAQELRAVGVNLWLDQLDILGGQRWDRAVEGALETCEGMLAILSPESLASNNVMDEISYALEEGKLIIPLLLRPCDIPFRLRRVQHIDFAVDYDTGFRQLLRALHIERLSATTETTEPEKQVSQASEKFLAETSTPTKRKPPKEQIVQRTVAQLPVFRKSRLMTRRTKLRGAIVGAAGGAIWGTATTLLSPYPKDWLASAGIAGVAGVVVGAMSTIHRKVFIAKLLGILAGFSLWAMNDNEVIRAAILGIPIGAVGGTIVGVIIKKWKGWT